MWISNYHNKYPELFQNYENKFFTDQITNNFHKYKNDEVIKEFEQIVKIHDFNYDAPYTLFLNLNNNFESKKLNDYVFKERLNSDNDIYSFIAKLKPFAEKINFEKYYQSNAEKYTKYINNVAKIYEATDITSFLKKYYGYNYKKKFYINLLPFATDGSFFCENNNGLYSCQPVYKYMKQNDLFAMNNEQAKGLLDTTVHEFSHGYIDSLTVKLNLVNTHTHLFDDIKDNMSQMAYPTDIEIINEHIIRAIESRFITLILHDENWANKSIEHDEKIGFIYIKPIVTKLIEYEHNRNIYPTFEAFYPYILKEIVKIKKINKSYDKEKRYKGYK